VYPPEGVVMGRSLLRALALNESNAAKVTIIVNDDEGAYIDFNYVGKVLGRTLIAGQGLLQAVRITAEHLDARTQPAFRRVVVLSATPGHVQFEGLRRQGQLFGANTARRG
jgi:hypothetical protein